MELRDIYRTIDKTLDEIEDTLSANAHIENSKERFNLEGWKEALEFVLDLIVDEEE